MASSQFLGGPSRSGRVLGPSLDKIIKNVAWRKHSHLVSACKSALDRFDSVTDNYSPDLSSPIPSISPADAEFALSTLILALETSTPKVIEPALECFFRLFSLHLIYGEVDRPDVYHQGNDSNNNNRDSLPGAMVSKIIESVCKLCSLQEEVIELGVLRVLLSMIRTPCVLIGGEYLVHIVKTCYNLYLGGVTGTNQICAKAVLAQIMVIVFARVEEDSMAVDVKTVFVGDLLELNDRQLSEGNSVQLVQSFIYEIMEVGDGVKEMKQLSRGKKSDSEDGENKGEDRDDGTDNETDGKQEHKESKIRESGFMLFKNLCKLSMKFSSQENWDDEILLRGKILSLELLRIITDNAGPIWRINERFLSIMKQYLCLSLLKNSALSVMAIFQLLCSIFMSLLSKFRQGLKAELGIFFPMLILRVLEDVLQPSFIQKMTVLNMLEKISEDPQTVVDIFVNYDCDLDAPNIYERIVNGLLKTALGPPPGSTTTLSPVQDLTFRVESVKCLVIIAKSMGSWMDLRVKVRVPFVPKRSQSDISLESIPNPNEESSDYDSETNFEMSDAATLEQRRAYKLELQVLKYITWITLSISPSTINCFGLECMIPRTL